MRTGCTYSDLSPLHVDIDFLQQGTLLTSSNRSTEASWHADYRDTAYIYIGGLPFDLSEGDVITIFSQFGEPVYVNLIRDKETGKSKGFAFLKYEDQRSTDLAVDNLGGALVLGRVLKVDHTRYKRKEEEEEEVEDNTDTFNGRDMSGDEKATGTRESNRRRTSGTEREDERRPMIKEERELVALMRDQDEDDPMKEYLIEEKKEKVKQALARLKQGSRKGEADRYKRHHHHHHRRHRSRRDRGNEGEGTSRERQGKERRPRTRSPHRSG